jgi:sugar lactone lactonase YvrE
VPTRTPLTDSLRQSSRVGALTWGIGLSATLLFGCAAPNPPAPAESTVTVLAQGAALHGANGIIFGPDGRLYVASVSSSVVAAVDPESGAIVDRWGPAEGIGGPDDLTFGPDGSMFWTDIAVGDVGRRMADGTTTVVASPGPGVNPITFSDDGRLFVSQCFLGDKLFEVDPDGIEEPRLITDQLGPGCGLNGMDWGPDGKLYGPRWFRGEVARVDVDSGAVETVATDFQIPAAVKFDSQGRLHVLDTQAGEVIRIDVASGNREVVGRPDTGRDNLAFDAEDRLFVSSFADGSVVEVTGPETIREVMAGGINSPGGLAFLPSTGGSGRLFLADTGALRELDPETGAEVHAAGGLTSDLGQVMSAHPHGEHLILSSSATVSIWDPDADQLVARFEGFEESVDAVGFGDDIIVSEYGTGRILRFHPESPDTRIVIASGLEAPAGLAVHDSDLYVADRSGTLFQILDDGATLAAPRPVASGLAGPEGIAAAPDGTLYVVEEDAGRVTRVDPDTGSATAVADGLPLRGLERQAFGESTSIGLLGGIAVGNGGLFVTSYPENSVYRIEF